MACTRRRWRGAAKREMLLKPFVAVGSTRPVYEVADVFREYGAAYQREHPVTWLQAKVIRDIVQCRTAALGGYVEQCPSG